MLAAEIAARERLPERSPRPRSAASATPPRRDDRPRGDRAARRALAARSATRRARSRAAARAHWPTLLHFAGESDRVHQLSAQRALETRARGRRPGSRSSTRWRAATPRSCSRPASTSGCDSRRAAGARRAHRRARARVLGLHWRLLRPARVGRHGRRHASTRSASRGSPTSSRQPIYRYFAARWDAIWAMIDDRLRGRRRLIAQAHELGVRAQPPRCMSQSAGQHASGSPTAAARWATSRR